jgi:hypothetical protein
MYFSSSPSVQRYFCSTCSATVFYTTEERPQCVDIAIGVLDAYDGARADSFLAWLYGTRIAFRKDEEGGWGERLFDEVESSAEKYRKERAHPNAESYTSE